ncbi:porin [Methylophaga sp. OBS1]|uniref:porin n=1 Tax=Methylophaga sp. OBS1 TaxID=2991933 RepID=UPI00225383D2|nr:porin [Methylophaga sp. OBS1]MCX4191366.1 porin [Methylophaga sp. OBS1]MCX4191688.1 porin [Methylophaga sp. OBS1]
MKTHFKSLTYAVALGSVAMTAPLSSQAAGTITFGEDQYVSVGFGFIGSYNSTEDAANDGSDSNDFTLNHGRLYLAGALNKYIKGMLNTEKSGGNDNFQVIDAVGIFELTPEFSIWAGRFLSPSSRANMAGPFFTSGDGYWADITARYGWNGGVIGRDDGVAIVGTALDQRLAYSFGAFEGKDLFRFSVGADGSGLESTSNPDQDDDLMYAGRLQYSFWDKEPGYYGTGNYLGKKDIFTIGVAAREKGDGSASTTEVGDYSQWTVDLLLEKKLAAGAVSLEAAYFDYDTDDVFLTEQGEAYYASLGYIFNEKVGWGQFMPFARYQSFDRDSGSEIERTDFGVNYIIDGYNASVTAVYKDLEIEGDDDADIFDVSVQLQF